MLLASCEDTDQTPRVVASDLGLHCLHMSPKRAISLNGLWFLKPLLNYENTYKYYNRFFQGPVSFDTSGGRIGVTYLEQSIRKYIKLQF